MVSSFQVIIEDFKSLRPSLSTPSPRPNLQSLLTAPVPGTVPCFSNLREPMFLPFSWPRGANHNSWTSNHSASLASEISLPRSRSSAVPVQASSSLPTHLTAPVICPEVSITPERPPRVTNFSLPEGTTLTSVPELQSASDSATLLESPSESRQISRVENPNFSSPIEVVEMSPQHSSTINVPSLETTEVSLSPSSNHPTNESSH